MPTTRLAAILFTPGTGIGYAARMQTDQERAMTAVKQNKTAICLPDFKSHLTFSLISSL